MAIFVPVDDNATGAEFYTPERDTPGNRTFTTTHHRAVMHCASLYWWSIAPYVRAHNNTEQLCTITFNFFNVPILLFTLYSFVYDSGIFLSEQYFTVRVRNTEFTYNSGYC